MDPVPRHKSFTSDSKSYMALRGHRASLIAEVPESIDNAFVSTLKAKARLLSGLEDATIVSRERATPSAGDVTPKVWCWVLLFGSSSVIVTRLSRVSALHLSSCSQSV